MSFKITSYNIYKGGKNGFEQLAQSVCDIQADCIGLLEANSWGEDNEKLLNKFSQLTRYPFFNFAKANTKYDIACLSKIPPINFVAIKNDFWHVVLINIFKTIEVGEVAVVFVHLNPNAESDRILEIENLLTILKQYPHAIILGDFNSLSPHDLYNQNELLQTLKTKHITKFGSEHLLFDTLTTLESAGYIDCGANQNNFEYTVPTPANVDPAHAIPLRIDYAFVSSNLSSFVKNISIKKGDIFNNASDHFPLVLEMDLTIQN